MNRRRLLFAILTIVSSVHLSVFSAEEPEGQQETPDISHEQLAPAYDVSHPQETSAPQQIIVETPEIKPMSLPAVMALGTAGTITGWYAAKWGLRIGGRMMKNPLIAATAGTLVISPVLKKTICAEQPEMNPVALFITIQGEWANDFKRAAARIKQTKQEWEAQTQATRKEYEQKYPALSALVKDMYKRTGIDQRIEEGKQIAQDLKQWKDEQQQKIIQALKLPRG